MFGFVGLKERPTKIDLKVVLQDGQEFLFQVHGVEVLYELLHALNHYSFVSFGHVIFNTSEISYIIINRQD